MRNEPSSPQVDTPISRMGIEDQITSLRRYAFALVRRSDFVDDLVQDCLTRALSRSHLFTPGRDLRPWLFTIMHREYLNWHRRNRRQPTPVPLDEIQHESWYPPSQEDALNLRDAARAFARLTPIERRVVLLTVVEGLSYDRVAELLGVPVGTVRSRLFRARARLKEDMPDTAPAPPNERSRNLAAAAPVLREREAPYPVNRLPAADRTPI